MAGNAPPQIPGCRDLSLIGERVARSLFSATSDRLGRAVTVIAYPPLSEGRTWADFDRAATTAQRLGVHPSMISIHEWGQADDGRPWIVTDPQPAEALDVTLKLDGPLEVERALQVGVLLAGALETAHGAGIVHGDLSPGRLVLGSHGEPLMTETGLAAFAVFPGLGALNNPVRYHAPPEVLERTEITTATDVYSLASTVYALIAGRAPHEKPAEVTDSNASLLLRVLQIAVPQIDLPGVPPWVVETLRGPLAPDPGKRPQQAIEVAWLLQDVQRRAGFAITEPVVLDLEDIEAQRSRRATGGAGGRSSWPAPASVEPPAPSPSPAVRSGGPGPEPAAPATGALWAAPPVPDPDPVEPAEVEDEADVPEPTIFPFEVADDEPPAASASGTALWPAAPVAPADAATLWPSSWPGGGEPRDDPPAWARSNPPDEAPGSTGPDQVILPPWSEPPPPAPENGSLTWMTPAEPDAPVAPPEVHPSAAQPAWPPTTDPDAGADPWGAAEHEAAAGVPVWTPTEPVLPGRGTDVPPTRPPPEPAAAPTEPPRPDLPRRGLDDPPATDTTNHQVATPPWTPPEPTLPTRVSDEPASWPAPEPVAGPTEPTWPDLPTRGTGRPPTWAPPETSAAEPTEPTRPDLPRRGAQEPPAPWAPPETARPGLPRRGAADAPAAHTPPWAPPEPPTTPTEPARPDLPHRGIHEPPTPWAPPEPPTTPTEPARPDLPHRGAHEPPTPWAPPEPPTTPTEPARPDLPHRGIHEPPTPWAPPEPPTTPTEPARPDLPHRGAHEPPTPWAPPEPPTTPTEPARPGLPKRGAAAQPAAWAPPESPAPAEPARPDLPTRGVADAPGAGTPAWMPPAIRPELPKRGAAEAPAAGGGGDEAGGDAPWTPPRPFWETAPPPEAPAAEADHSNGNGSTYGVPRPPELDVLPAWYTDPLPNGRKQEPAARRLPGAGDELRSLFGAVVGEPAAEPPPPSGLEEDHFGPATQAAPTTPAPLPAPAASRRPEAPFRLPRPAESGYATAPPQARPAPPAGDAGAPKPRSAPASAAGPPALPIIVLVAVVVVLIAGVLWLVVTGDDAGTPASERSRDDAAEAPTGLAVTQVPEGAQLTWEGSDDQTYVVTVLSSTAPPQALPPAPGTSALVPSAGAPPGTLQCFTVARAPASNDSQPGTPTEPVCAAGATPEQMLPAQ